MADSEEDGRTRVGALGGSAGRMHRPDLACFAGGAGARWQGEASLAFMPEEGGRVGGGRRPQASDRADERGVGEGARRRTVLHFMPVFGAQGLWACGVTICFLDASAAMAWPFAALRVCNSSKSCMNATLRELHERNASRAA